MTKEEYQRQLKLAARQYEAAKEQSAKEYALSNNTVMRGDIVKDHIGNLKVESIKVHMTMYEPCCVYYGIELKSDLTPAKKQTNRPVYQCNLIP